MTQNQDGKFKKSYRKWSSMNRRCYDPNHPAWPFYGGRGIEVCARWRGKNGYARFVEDMGEPLDGITLGRIDNAKGYQPDNCRWETWKEQASNRRPKRVNPLSLWGQAKLAGLPYQVVYQRVHKHRWPVELALSTAVMGVGKRRTGRQTIHFASGQAAGWTGV